MNLILFIFISSCEDFLEVPIPTHKIMSETVFNDETTAISAMTGIYHELFNATFSSGGINSVTALAGLSADILEPISTNNYQLTEFKENEISPSNSANLKLWASAYKIIYMVNSLLEGLENSQNISQETIDRLQGEAKFVRAFTYLQLLALYGEVPLITTTDYRNNALSARNSIASIETQILTDLNDALIKVNTSSEEIERTRITKFAVMALLARVHCYQENWEKAAELSSLVIAETRTFEILQNLDLVFLANSREAIWQISPNGRGNILTYPNEGQLFVGTSTSSIKLSDSFVSTFEPNDSRMHHWIGFYSSGTRTFNFPYKYKDRSSNNNVTEYSMVLRLAEQYLIRAEARAMLGNLSDAIADIDKIRLRAGLGPIININPEIGKEALLALILEERKKELFSEWGHRWLDLKRTGTAAKALEPIKPLWEESDVLFPIPEEERIKNPNLGQNTGY